VSSIFDINARLLRAYEMAESGDFDEDAINGTLEMLELELEQKADQYAAHITEIDGQAETISREIERLQALKKSKQGFKDRLKTNLQAVMVNTGRVKFRTDLHNYFIQKNPPALFVERETDIPPEFFIQPPPVLDRSAVRDALKAGTDVPGASLTQGESLRIK
jgi:hypothetical protein